MTIRMLPTWLADRLVRDLIRTTEDWVVQDRVCRETGGRVLVIDARLAPDFDEHEGGRWVTWCDRHETFAQHATRALAVAWAAVPTVWCGMCAEGLT